MSSAEQEEKFLFRLVLILDLSCSPADIWLYLPKLWPVFKH